MFDTATMQARFHELGRKRDEIMAQVEPLSQKRDALVAEHDAAMRPLTEQIKAASSGLFEIDQERANIARALRGKTGAAA